MKDRTSPSSRLTSRLPKCDPSFRKSSPSNVDQAMLTEDWISLVVIVVCLVLSFFFSGSETALTAFSRARMLQLEKNGNARARLVNRLVETRERMIGAILAGNNVANIAASALTTGMLYAWFGDVGVLYATAILPIGIVEFIEDLPQTIAIKTPARIA